MKKINLSLLITMAVLLTGLPDNVFSQNVIWLESDFNAPRLVKTGQDGTELATRPLEVGSLPQSMALNTNGDSLYWVGLAFIDARINATASDFITVSVLSDSLSALRGIVLDTLNRHIYWTSTNLVNGPKIMRADMNGQSPDTLINFGPGSKSTPRAISLDVSGGKMYWANFSEGKIQRADMTIGATPEDILTGLNGPSGIAVDSDSGKVFWTEMNGHQIKCADLDGSNDTLLVSDLSYPNYISVDRSQNRMAWTEMGTGKVKSAALDGSDIIDYQVTAVAPTGIVIEPGSVTNLSGSEANQLPGKFALQQNYPNPFNPVTHIKYALPNKAQVTLTLFDMLGRKIKVLIDEQQPAGHHTLKFEAGNLASGIYLYRILTNDGFSSTKKLILLK